MKKLHDVVMAPVEGEADLEALAKTAREAEQQPAVQDSPYLPNAALPPVEEPAIASEVKA